MLFLRYLTDAWSWRRSDFFRHTGTLAGGVGLAQMIPFLLSPVISRLYLPEDYAVLAAYTSITVLLSIVATGMYSHALMIDRSDEKAVNTAMAAFLVTLGTALLSFVAVLFFRRPLAGLTGNIQVLGWLFFLPLTVLFAGGTQTLMVWNTRKKRYRRLAVNRVVQAATLTAVTLTLGFMGYRHSGLLVGLLAGQGAAFAVLLAQTWYSERKLLATVNKPEVGDSFRTHKDFPKYNMPQGFLDGFRDSGILIILSNFFGAAVLGSYSFAMSILNKPVQIVGQPVAQVFYQQAADLHKEGQPFASLARKTLLSLVLLFMPLLILFVGWGDAVFAFVFGENWITAGRYASILIVWMLFRFVNSPISSIPLILNRQRTFFYFGAVNNISLPLALFLCGITGHSATAGLLALTALGCLNMLAQMIWILNISRKR